MFRTVKSAKIPRGPWAKSWRLSMYLPPFFSLSLLVLSLRKQLLAFFCLVGFKVCAYEKGISKEHREPIGKAIRASAERWCLRWPGQEGERLFQGKEINMEVWSQRHVLGTAISDLESPGFKLWGGVGLEKMKMGWKQGPDSAKGSLLRVMGTCENAVITFLF